MGNYLQSIETDVKKNEEFGERESIMVGGFPISAYHDITKGGGVGGNKPPTMVEGMAKIQHLYIPLGLVIFPRTTSHCQNIHKNTEADILDESMFHRLYQPIIKMGKNVQKKSKRVSTITSSRKTKKTRQN